MWKRTMLCALALMQMAAVNLKICCTVSVDGKRIPGSYSPACAESCLALSRIAAEEICEKEAVMPVVVLRRYLSFRPPENERQTLTDAILLSSGGVAVLKSVTVRGVRMGAVKEDCDIHALLKENIVSQQPNCAVYGIYSGEIEVNRCYGRSGSETNSSDMVLLVSGMAPVMYYDSNGERA